MKFAILGAGPSGMMAAHAVAQYGHQPTILDKEPDKTRRNSGVYYLHDPCDLPLKPFTIYQNLIGGYLSPDEIKMYYGFKVYGQRIEKVSVLNALTHPEIQGYNAEQALGLLWDIYGSFVKQRTIQNYDDIKQLLEMEDFDGVVSTIPARVLFPNECYVWAETHIKVGKAPLDESYILYNVNPYIDWYRCSAMFGVFVQEFGFGKCVDKANGYQIRKVMKVMNSEPIVAADKHVLLTGRYGAWDKTCLTHNVYERTLAWLDTVYG